jgi:FkbM family methyltransferase
MKSGASESSYFYLSQYYSIPEDVEVSHLPEELKKSNKPYKILWGQHAYDQPVFANFHHEDVTHIVSPSHWAKEQLIKFHNVPKNKITVIPTGVSDSFTFGENKTKTFIHTSIPYKGLELLPHIIRLIHTRHPDAKFKIFSSMSLYGPSNDPYIELYEELKTLPNVEYSAAVDQEELVAHYQDSAFFIHPNIWEETFCVSMAEAMKCGAYPIITDIGALQEVAGENFSSVVPIDGIRTSKGYQVTERFINTFAEVCCTALDYFEGDRTYYNQISKSLSNHISQKCNWKKVATQWEKLINTVRTHKVFFRENSIDKSIYDEVYIQNAYEIEKLNEDDIVLDIGSHCGYFSKLCLDKGSKNVIAFEADESNYQYCLKNLFEYQGWKCHNLAVWKETCDEVSFYTYPNSENTGLNSFYKNPYMNSYEENKVKTISLDDILSSYDKINILKIDAEGSEYDILMNSKSIQKIENIVGEYHNDMTDRTLDDLEKYLNSENFVIYKKINFNATSGLFFAKQKSKINEESMTTENTALSYQPISAEQAVTDDTYLRQAFDNVMRWEASDKELAQGRTNFQLEKFALLDTHTLPAAFENTLKSRRQMAEGYMYKLIEMKEKVREFEYKWKDQDRSQPIFWEESGPGGGSKKLCWFDLDELSLTHYLKSCELEIRDRLHQMQHLDKILDKLVEENGGKPVTREQFLENDALYWERRFADQAMDEMVSAQTGISIGNLHSMRRASAPAIVDKRNELPEGYLPLNKMLESPQGKMEFLNDLQKKVLTGIQEVTGENLGMITGSTEEQKKLEGN